MASKPTKLRKSRIEKYYQNIVIIFIVLTVIIVALIVYFSFSKTVISITPKVNTFDTDFNLSIVPEDSQEDFTYETVIGEIVTTDVELSKSFDYTTELEEVPAKATGTVTIYNNYSKSQPLVENTRLLSDSGVLFRTAETVTVAAGSNTTIGVIADLEGNSGNLAPTNFTIVALWEGLKDKIYATSTEAMTGGTKMAKVVSADNIIKAKDEIISDILDQAVVDLKTIVTDESKTLIKEALDYTILSSDSTAEENAEVDNFTLTYKLKVIAPVTEISDINTFALNKLKESLPTNFELIESDDFSLTYEIKNIDLEANTAVLKINTEGEMTVKISSPIFERDNLTNKDKHQIKVYFSQFDDEIEKIEVNFNPFWVVRSPQLEDHIEIELL